MLITYKTPSGRIETVECAEADLIRVIIEIGAEMNELVEVRQERKKT